jgi:hypothetical protein
MCKHKKVPMIESSIAVEWDAIGRTTFDRLIEALIRRLNPKAVVRAFDGRGGDGGRDITVDLGGHLTIYQLKYFPDGFSGDRATTRKRQITRSYKAAMEHKPAAWVLVYPGRFTPGEQSFVDGLADSAHTPESRTSWCRPDLDDMFAKDWDLAAYLLRPHIEHLAELFKIEQTIIGNTNTDLVSRVAGLQQTLDSIDPNWTVDFMSTAAGPSWSPRAKHANAQRVSPLMVKFAVDFEKLSSEDTAAFKKVVKFGWDGAVTLPPEAVATVELVGPQWLSFTKTNLGLEVGIAGSAVPVGTPMELRFPDEGRAFAGMTTFGNQGERGYSLRGRIALTDIEVFIPRMAEDPGTINFKREVGSVSAFDLVQAMQMTQKLEGHSGPIELRLADDILCKFTLDNWGRDPDPELDDLLQRAQDVDAVQRYTGNYFQMPSTMTNVDIATFRAVRLMLEGHRVTLPRARVFTTSLTGEADAGLKGLLERRSAIRAEVTNFSVEALNREFVLGSVTLTAVVEVENGKEALEALEAGTAIGLEIRMKPIDGHNFTAFMPDCTQVEGLQIPPLQRWELSDFHEPGLFRDAALES